MLRKVCMQILTLFFDALRLCTLNTLVWGSTVASTVYSNPWKWIAHKLNNLIFTCHFAAEFIYIRDFFFGKEKRQQSKFKLIISVMSWKFEKFSHKINKKQEIREFFESFFFFIEMTEMRKQRSWRVYDIKWAWQNDFEINREVKRCLVRLKEQKSMVKE